MRIGFTGTQAGMTEFQQAGLRAFLVEQQTQMVESVHHGDCIGSDAEFHALAQELMLPVIVHPPTDSSKRAFCLGGIDYRQRKPYLERNQDIVRESDLIVAAPRTQCEELRSGTWATIRYARKIGRLVIVLWPDGQVEV